MKPLIIATVQHTGSRLLVDMVRRHGWVEEQQLKVLTQPVADNGHIFCHATAANAAAIKARIRQGCVCLTTLRHPREVVASWHKRGKETDFLWKQWRAFFEVVAPHALFLPIDTPQRETHLARISERIGKPLQTDWPQIGAWTDPATQLDRHDPYIDQLAALWIDHGAFFEQFYNPPPGLTGET